MHWTGRMSKMNHLFLLVLTLTLLAGAVYPAESLPSQEQRLNNEQGASPDIEESKVLLEELEELLDEELMTNNNGDEDEIALLPEEKHSVPTDDCLLKTTDTAYRYRWDVPQLTGTRFTFQASARNDVHVGLSSVHHDVSDMYEIVIGGWRNTRSAIRRRKQGPNLAFVSTPGINSPTELRTFWINCAPDGTISVGKGDDAQPFMSWRDPNPLRVSYAGYSTGWGSTGRWKFCSIRDDCLLKTTDTTYRYRWDVPQLTGTRFTFQASARNDVHVGLSSVHHDVSDMYEIVIGGWRNTRSAIRRRKQGPNLAFVSTPGINSPTELRTFWINCAPDGTISVGKGDDAQPFMSWRDPNPLRVSYAGYSTGWGSTGRWKFCSIRDDCLLKTTDTAYRYRWDVPQLTGTRFTFQASARNDVHVGLSSVHHDVSDMYEIVIGGWRNTRSAIRRRKQGPNLAFVSTPGINSPTELRTFWINCAPDGTISVGKGDDAQPFMSWRDPNPLRVSYAGYSTGWGSTGRWKFCSIRDQRTFTDPNLASGRPTHQSSTGHEGDPARAVDGNRSPHWAHNSCTHTNEENDPWWYVDLGHYVTVDHVTIVNRRDCCSERITPFDVHVGYSTDVASNPRCGGHHHFPPTETEHAVNCGGLRGRYVGIRLPGKRRILTLCEVEVYAAPNLALGKPTSQSNVAHNGFASRATDGCRDPNWGSQCCTHTPAEANPWLQVDLGTSVRVQWVVIMNRADCCRERLSPFSVHIGNNARVDQNPRCGGHHTIPAGKDKDAINCNGLTGRYVGIRLPGYGRILTVCEIEVYAGM
ncbi:PREDICTED: uncharacterized protein LOC109478195 [Branchiostoma belcheri]|uniref:Uncharacterized protein LOC109478195 n=1 Tax=Branchiostoma belcheri TaxID=7741 RepID=A0A6P4ZEQ7_BRABE|nr:PREDICTED: uncharacterized protein LOC109478195 [Branchiostoma belcheri]XP_019635214.1 PREDICTED: uncharacterized protein LOC109478195 [Branchiostoma belcheri]